MAQATGSAVAAFGGPQVEKLLELMHQSRSNFDAMPIGPLGTHITLQDKRWGMAVETALGNTLNSFLVSSARDKSMLYQLCKQVRT
jgi:chromosome segregation ATPase